MIKGDKLSGVILCSEMGPIRNMFMHPRHYCCLLQAEKCLVYYDLLALNSIWVCEQPGASKLWTSEDLRVAFSLDFNVVYVATNDSIHGFSWAESTMRLATHRIGFSGKRESTPLLFAVQADRFLMVYDSVVVTQEVADWQKFNLTSLGETLQQAVLVQSLCSEAAVAYVSCSEASVALWRIHVLQGTVQHLARIEQKWRVQAVRLDDKHRKAALLCEARIEIVSYRE